MKEAEQKKIKFISAVAMPLIVVGAVSSLAIIAHRGQASTVVNEQGTTAVLGATTNVQASIVEANFDVSTNQTSVLFSIRNSSGKTVYVTPDQFEAIASDTVLKPVKVTTAKVMDPQTLENGVMTSRLMFVSPSMPNSLVFHSPDGNTQTLKLR